MPADLSQCDYRQIAWSGFGILIRDLLTEDGRAGLGNRERERGRVIVSHYLVVVVNSQNKLHR